MADPVAGVLLPAGEEAAVAAGAGADAATEAGADAAAEDITGETMTELTSVVGDPVAAPGANTPAAVVVGAVAALEAAGAAEPLAEPPPEPPEAAQVPVGLPNPPSADERTWLFAPAFGNLRLDVSTVAQPLPMLAVNMAGRVLR